MNIGSGWKKTSQAGKTYISGVIQSPFLPDGEMRFAIFAVDEKKSENAPDYNIVWNKAKPKTEGTGGTTVTTDPFNDDAIPF